jgi:hypothetical protein
VHEEEQGFGLATYRSLIVVVWGRTVRLPDIQALTKVQRELIDRYGHFAVLTIIRAGLLMSVDDEVRRLSENNLREFQAFNRGNSMVVEAGGLRATFFRSVMTGIQLLARSPVPLKVFDNIDEAVHWVLDRPNIDPVVVAASDPIIAAAFELADRYGAVDSIAPQT